MTEKLKNMMDRTAAGVDFGAVDVDAIVTAGDRKVRRNRGVAAVAGLAAAAVVGAGAFAFLGGGEPRGDGVDPAGGLDSTITWVVGDTLHTPDSTYPLGHDVWAYVRTSEGIAFIGMDFGVYSFDGEKVERLGTASENEPRLVSDTEDSLVGWLEAGTDRIVLADAANGERVVEVSPAGGALVQIALDDRTLYWEDDDGTYAIDSTGEPATATNGGRLFDQGVDLLAVENGLKATRKEGTNTAVIDWGEGKVSVDDVHDGPAFFSQDGTWILFAGTERTVFDASTGEALRLDLKGYQFAVPYEFPDEQTAMVMAGRTEDGPIELLRCALPAGDCTQVTDDLGSFESGEPFAIPVGESLMAAAEEAEGASEPQPGVTHVETCATTSCARWSTGLRTYDVPRIGVTSATSTPYVTQIRQRGGTHHPRRPF